MRTFESAERKLERQVAMSVSTELGPNHEALSTYTFKGGDIYGDNPSNPSKIGPHIATTYVKAFVDTGKIGL